MTRTSDTRGGAVALSKEGLPDWLDPVVRAVETVQPLQLSRAAVANRLRRLLAVPI